MTVGTAATYAPAGQQGRLRKWGPWLLLVAVAAVVLGIGLDRGGGRPSLDSQVQHIASEVRCPVCNGETVEQSQAAISVQIRTDIRTDLQKGESQDQILSSLVASYGTGILEKPQAKGISLLVWVLPVVALLAGAVFVAGIVRRWGGGAKPALLAGAAVGGEASDAAGPLDVADPGGPTGGEPGPPAGPVSLYEPGRGAPAAEEADGETAGEHAAAEEADGETAGGVSAGAPPRPSRSLFRRGGRRTRLVTAGIGFVLMAGGVSWAVAASSGTRLPGEEITGQALSSETVASDIEAATTDEDRNDWYGALKLYSAVLKSDPTQVQALAGEGWLLAQTGQPALLKQGLGMLAQAEQVDASYAASHLYRGLALLGEDDYGDSVPELQWYLAHSPDPKLVPSVKTALAKAEKGEAAAAPATTVPTGSTAPTTRPAG